MSPTKARSAFLKLRREKFSGFVRVDIKDKQITAIRKIIFKRALRKEGTLERLALLGVVRPLL